MFLRFTKFYAVDGGPSGSSTGTDDSTLGKEDVIELLGEDETETLSLEDTKSPVKTKETDDAEKESDEETKDDENEVDELKEIEEELEGPSEEDLELMTPVRRREILAKYPKLFKDFPYLEKAYYREQQFTELLPTIADAKLAVEKAQVLDVFDREIMSGNIATVLQAAKDEDNKAFLKIADNYLPALKQVDQGAYFHVLGGVIKDTIVTMVREARSMGENGQPLQAAANILNQFVFGRNQFEPHTKLAGDDKPEDKNRENELKEQQQQIIVQQFETARDTLQTKTDNVLKATIDGNIDPRKTMTEYIRGKASKDALEMLENLMAKDTRFQSVKDKLWEKAFQSKFSKESLESIRAAYLSKAKTLLPSVIKKARNEALRGMGKRVSDDSDSESTNSERKNPISGTRQSSSQPTGKIKKPSDIPRGMSTLDVMMQD